MLRRLLAGVLVAFLAASSAQAAPTVIELWPAGKVPGEQAGAVPAEQATKKNDVVTSITNVSVPTISIYPAPKDKNTGAAVLIAPGGGYNVLAWDHEGEQVAAWANSVGITAAILKYRVPRRPDTAKDKPPLGALQDAQRAMGIFRSRAAEWGVDTKRIGMLGFSAGGHLTAWSITNFDTRSYPVLDDIDKTSCRPDWAVLVYPGGVVDKETFALKPELPVTKDCPPCFFVHAWDDRVATENSVQFYLALKKAGVPAEMHLYSAGGHGFGMRPSTRPASTWPKRCEEWLATSGVLTGK